MWLDMAALNNECFRRGKLYNCMIVTGIRADSAAAAGQLNYLRRPQQQQPRRSAGRRQHCSHTRFVEGKI
jgi:hypothetical protein